MKRLALFICTLLCANVLLAQTTFWIGDIQYEITSTNPAEVEVHDANLSITTANITETVTYNETTYSVTSIGDHAFNRCSSLTSITIPNSVTTIGEGAFAYCSILTSITIPNSVTTIGEGAFAYCSSLTSITIPNSVTSIGDWAFERCYSLTSITIPNSVTSIGGAAFYQCSSLTSVTLSNNITVLPCYNGYDYYYGFFEYCSSLTSVTIPNSVTSIGKSAFKYCSSLTSIDIPNSVTIIRDDAFFYCSSLTSITIPNSVTYIGKSAFKNCSSLTSVTFGESLFEIKENAFATSSLLQNITCLGTIPPILYNNSFPNPNTATLTVPCGSLEAYSDPTSFWNMLFTDRIEEDCGNNDGDDDEDDGGDSGIEDVIFEDLSVYPNPTRGKVTFNQAIEKIEVIDLSGKTVQTYENVNEINIEALPAGVYHLRMTIGDKTTTRKVIKE